MLKKVRLDCTNRLINHGPLLVISAEYKGQKTFTPIAWNMPVEHTPPLVAITVSKENFINELIKKSGQFCVNVPFAELKNKVINLGKVSGKDTDKMKLEKLKVKRCAEIEADYWADCAAVIECKLVKTVNIGDVDVFIGEALYCRANEYFKKGCWQPDELKTIHHLGGLNFVTVSEL